jgi:hypothetical protein
MACCGPPACVAGNITVQLHFSYRRPGLKSHVGLIPALLEVWPGAWMQMESCPYNSPYLVSVSIVLLKSSISSCVSLLRCINICKVFIIYKPFRLEVCCVWSQALWCSFTYFSSKVRNYIFMCYSLKLQYLATTVSITDSQDSNGGRITSYNCTPIYYYLK